jgi:mannose-1-phosphate guanylyltransferase
LRKNLADRSVRIALSNLLINPDRKNNANAFANALQYSPDDAKAALIKVLTTPRLLPDLKGIKNIVENATGQDLKSILYDIR